MTKQAAAMETTLIPIYFFLAQNEKHPSYVPDSITVKARLSNQDIGKKRRRRNRLVLFFLIDGFKIRKKKFASEVVVALRKAGLSVPRRELAAAGLADESVSVFGLWYLVDVHHLDCPLLFGCAKKSKHKKGKRLTSMKKTADFHQYDKTVDLASYCLTCYSSLQKGPFQIHQRFQTFIVMF
jgi:hypothetical protein